jgi:uncharacterized protein (UPF0276 family)
LRHLFHGHDGHEPDVACAELIANRYFADGGVSREWELEELAGMPLIVHGLSGNAASAMGPEKDYLEQIRRLADYTDALICSDHLAFTGAHGRSLGHLAPNRFDDELLGMACRHIEVMTQATGRRICLENLATKTTLAGSTYSPEEFFLRLLEESDAWDCLLDVTNVWINAQNRPLDPLDFISAIPPARIRYVHLAGGRWIDDELVDTHSESVHPEVFDVLAFLLQRAQPQVVIVERDSNWQNAYAEVRANLAAARDVVARVQSEKAVDNLLPQSATA